MLSNSRPTAKGILISAFALPDRRDQEDRRGLPNSDGIPVTSMNFDLITGNALGMQLVLRLGQHLPMRVKTMFSPADLEKIDRSNRSK